MYRIKRTQAIALHGLTDARQWLPWTGWGKWGWKRETEIMIISGVTASDISVRGHVRQVGGNAGRVLIMRWHWNSRGPGTRFRSVNRPAWEPALVLYALSLKGPID